MKDKKQITFYKGSHEHLMVKLNYSGQSIVIFKRPGRSKYNARLFYTGTFSNEDRFIADDNQPIYKDCMLSRNLYMSWRRATTDGKTAKTLYDWLTEVFTSVQYEQVLCESVFNKLLITNVFYDAEDVLHFEVIQYHELKDGEYYLY